MLTCDRLMTPLGAEIKRRTNVQTWEQMGLRIAPPCHIAGFRLLTSRFTQGTIGIDKMEQETGGEITTRK